MKTVNGKLKWGIIGCGDVCEVKSGPAFSKVPNSELVAVMRRDKEKAADYASRHKVPRYYSDASELINDTEVNAIYIATPPSSHEAYLEESSKAGKPVYVEKPVTLNAESCERMIQISRMYGNRASVAHYRRGLPLFNKVKSLIHEGVIGNVRLIDLRTLQPADSKIVNQAGENWRIKPAVSGGGFFHDLSPHQLDILYWIFGAPRNVFARSWNQAKRYAAPDMTIVNAVFDNPIKGNDSDVCLNGVWAFNLSTQATEDSCEIIGDKGLIRFAFFRKSVIDLVTDSGSQTIELDYPENIQLPMIDRVVRYFRGEGPNPCSLEEAMVMMKVIDQSLKN